MTMKESGEQLVAISRRGADRIRSGHVWVYRSDVVDASGTAPGVLVTVTEASDPKARPHRADKNVRSPKTLGTAFYSSSSQIALRMISPKAVEDVEQLVRERIRAAIAYRERFVDDTNAYRVVFSEGDFLPGLIVDRYHDILAIQVLTQAMDTEAMRQVFISELAEQLRPQAIFERVDARVRNLEQLPEKATGIIWEAEERVGPDALVRGHQMARLSPDGVVVRAGEHGSPILVQTDTGRVGAPAPTQGSAATRACATEFQMNGVRFLYDALAGQKTGAFLDQRENYAVAAQYARGEALDVFCYQGGFALHLARTCESITGVDSSRPALESAEQNAKLNGREIEWIEANAFDLLRDYSDSGHKYDTIVLDPPAFAKGKRDVATALRGYKELNLRALKMLQPGGILVSCSCSHHVSTAELLETVQWAALDSHRIIRILENRAAAKDHPSVLGIPETSYLKCLILSVS